MKVKEGDVIYDYCWYPYADARNLQTYCFLSTSRVAKFSFSDLINCLLCSDIRYICGMQLLVN